MSYFSGAELREFDRLLEDIEHHAQDNPDLLERLSKLSISVIGNLSDMRSVEPLSDAYIDHVKAVHEEIIGQQHGSHLEGLPEQALNAGHERDWPYPWGTKSGPTVAKFLISYGLLLQVADLPPNARVLEVGCGVGSLTWNLARMGYRVDALDPNDLQCQIVRAATKDFPSAPNVVAMTLDQWLDAKPASYKYDAVIFFESFHHILDHHACLRRLLANHVELDAKVLLGAEPIFEDECDSLPYAWGPRLDGESLRAMRKWGWLELGFTRRYIEALFQQFGLAFNWVKNPGAMPLSQVVIGYKTDNAVNQTIDNGERHIASITDPVDFAVDSMPAYLESFNGLANAESWGRWSIGKAITFKLKQALPPSFSVELNLASVFGPNVHKNIKMRVGSEQRLAKLDPIEERTVYIFHFDNVGSDEIEIVIPHPCRPKDMPELGLEDPRRIGIGLKTMKISLPS
jgi:2-polyprenyl-3-methyl-5-hydroxy-6-metoxy-1,4-benzoquinol methylase